MRILATLSRASQATQALPYSSDRSRTSVSASASEIVLGEEVLRSSQVGDFTATCLRCGYIANDPYNWYRP